MAELFTSLADFKTQVGGAISTTLELTSLEPVIYDAARRHLTPYLGVDFYEDLATAYAGDSMSAAQTALLPKVRKPLALLTMHEYAKIGGIEFGEGGIHRNENDSKKAAFRYQEKEYSRYMIEKGYEALELLLKFLSDNTATYTDWAASDEATMHLNPLLNYAADFRRLLNVQCDRWTFECMRPLIAEVETVAVQAILPAAFYYGLKERHVAGTLTVPEKELRTRIRNAIGHFAMAEAIQQHWVHTSHGRVQVIEEFGEQSAVNRTMPANNAGFALTTQQVWGDRNTAYWKQYICDNPNNFDAVFDEASGGTNTDADAWHINTDDEQLLADAAEVVRKQAPALWL